VWADSPTPPEFHSQTTRQMRGGGVKELGGREGPDPEVGDGEI